MNKFIKSDIEDAVKLMRTAIMNALNAIENGEIKEIYLGEYISETLLFKCLKQYGYVYDAKSITWKSSKKCIKVNISPCSIKVANTKKVTISQTLSKTCEIVAESDDESILKEECEKQLYLPSSISTSWTLDDYCVQNEE